MGVQLSAITQTQLSIVVTTSIEKIPQKHTRWGPNKQQPSYVSLNLNWNEEDATFSLTASSSPFEKSYAHHPTNRTLVLAHQLLSLGKSQHWELPY